MVQFKCRTFLGSDDCDWYAQEMRPSDLRDKIIEHAKTAHKMDPIPAEIMSRIDKKLNRKSSFRTF